MKAMSDMKAVGDMETISDMKVSRKKWWRASIKFEWMVGLRRSSRAICRYKHIVCAAVLYHWGVQVAC